MGITQAHCYYRRGNSLSSDGRYSTSQFHSPVSIGKYRIPIQWHSENARNIHLLTVLRGKSRPDPVAQHKFTISLAAGNTASRSGYTGERSRSVRVELQENKWSLSLVSGLFIPLAMVAISRSARTPSAPPTLTSSGQVLNMYGSAQTPVSYMYGSVQELALWLHVSVAVHVHVTLCVQILQIQIWQCFAQN